jgi:outer membrane protein OmpA-like peptidoglycan-associated protein
MQGKVYPTSARGASANGPSTANARGFALAYRLHPKRKVSIAVNPQKKEEGAMVRMTRLAVLVPAVLVAVSGCATKDWVRDLMGKKEVEIGQRMDGLSGEIKTTQGDVKATQASLGETNQMARGAGERADAAMNKAGGVDGRLSRLWSNRYNQKAVDTVEVYFGFDKADLSDGAQTALLGVVKELQASPTLIVRLGGFTDPTGKRDYNYGLAQRRVEAVRRFLVDKGVELSRVQAIGMGPLEDRGVPEEKKRRVTVTLMTDLD